MLLDCREAADAFVVGERFIVVGDETPHLHGADIAEHGETEMAVEQQVAALLVLRPRHDERLNGAHLRNRAHDALVLHVRVFWVSPAAAVSTWDDERS